MGDDLRLDADYFGNVKILRLQRRLGDAGVMSHLRLLCYVRKFHPAGDLDGLDAEGIALAAGWSGDVDQFCQTLSELILIERSDTDQWRIHDWKTVNEWAAGTAGRRAHAQKLNHQRWYIARKIACPDAQCIQCEPVRRSASELISEQTPRGVTSDSDKESSFRLVTSRNENSSPAEKKQRATRVPEPFPITPEMRAFASKDFPQVDIDAQTPAFVDYWRGVPGQKGLKLDWVSTWRNDVRTCAERGKFGNAKANKAGGFPNRAHRKSAFTAQELPDDLPEVTNA